jgi:hypothetical protein
VKKDDLMMLGALLVGAAFFMTKSKAAAPRGGVTEIQTAGDANGWRYFSNGTAISPDGTYYQGGVAVWNPTM